MQSPVPEPRLLPRQLRQFFAQLRVAVRPRLIAVSQLLNAAIDKLRNAGCEAVDGLIEIAKDPASTSAARVTAWRSVLEFALRGDEQEQIKERLAELESSVSEGASEGWPSNV